MARNPPQKDIDDLNALFAADEFWKSDSDRLNSAMRTLSNITNLDNHHVVRALVLLSIMQERRVRSVERLNWVISAVLIALAVVQVYFASSHMAGTSVQVIFQSLLFLVALGAAAVAILQLQTHKQTELLKTIESVQVREARRIVVLEIEPIKDTKWWEDEQNGKGDRLEKAAATVCASYDILATIADNDKIDRWLYRLCPRFSYRSLFVKHWAESICRMHLALEGYLEYRRESADAYHAFTQLSEDAEPYRKSGTGKAKSI